VRPGNYHNVDLLLPFIRNTKIEKDLPAWDVLEAVEETCKYDRFS
jgi:hypothetical protein